MGARKITTSFGELQRRGVEGTPCLQPPPCRLPLARKLDSSTASFPGCRHGHTMVRPPQLLRVQCIDPPPVLLQPCSETWKPVTALTTAGTSERKGALPAGKQERLAAAKGFGARPEFSCIQLWHAAVADYSAVQLLPLRERPESGLIEQIIGNFSRYCYLLVS